MPNPMKTPFNIGGPVRRHTLADLQKQGWVKLSKHRYRHRSGVVLMRNINRRLWEIKGGRRDGERFERLWVAAERVTRQ